MQLAVVDPADRDRELVAHAASEGTGLCKGEVMRIRRHAAAHKARLPQNKLPVIFIAQANRFPQSMDRAAPRAVLGSLGSFLARPCVSRAGGHHILVGDGMERRGRYRTIRRPAWGRIIRACA
jgi:hypothetical protein